LFPETAFIVAYAKAVADQQEKMQKWYLNPRTVLNRQPQTKAFSLPDAVLKYAIEAKTDAFGRYSFDRLKPGRYLLVSMGWQTGSYNKEVYAGSSEYSDGTGLYGIRGRIDRKKLVPVNFKTYLLYNEFVEVGSRPVAVESRLRVDYNQMSVAYDK
jgi:hypothetical protein